MLTLVILAEIQQICCFFYQQQTNYANWGSEWIQHFRKGCRYVCQLSLHRNAEHLPSLIAPSVNLVRYRAVITGGAVWAAAVPEEECKHTRSSSKNSQLRVFLECPNEPSPLCLQFQADGKPAICLASVSLSGLPRGHTHTHGGVLSPER